MVEELARRAREEDRRIRTVFGERARQLQRLGLTTQSVVTPGQVPAPAEVAGRLGVEQGATVLVRRRVMSANDIPVQLAASYFPLDIADGTQLAEADTGPGGAYSRLADLGHAPAAFTEDIDVRRPTDDEAHALRMGEDQRVYEIVRTAETAAGRIVEVNVIVLPVHQWRLRFTFPAE